MNEILAMVVIVFDTERYPAPQEKMDWNQMSDEQIASDFLLDYLFDADSIKADVYACFDRVL